MLNLIINGFIIGLSTGIYCLLHCAPILLSLIFLNNTPKPPQSYSFKDSLKNNLPILLNFFLGRLMAYVLFGSLIGFLGSVITNSNIVKFIIALSYLIIALILLNFIFGITKKKYHFCTLTTFKKMRSSFLIGMFSGISICPPFILATLSALEMNSTLHGAIYFGAFYFGTIVYFLPLGFIKIPTILNQISRYAAIMVALAFIILGTNSLLNLFTSHKLQLFSSPKIQNKQPTPENSSSESFLQTIKDKNLSLQEAAYYTKSINKTVQCLLCPHKCILSPSSRGICKARINIDGSLKTLVYGKPIVLHLDPIEKKPLYHFLPDSYAFSIATASCNLNCIFCQNWEISQSFPENSTHYNLSPKATVDAALKSGAKSIAYTYTEPTIYYEYMLATAKTAHQKGLKNVWITCGYINKEPLRELCKYIDAANVDLKGFSNKFYQTYTTGNLQPVLDTLKTLKENNVLTEITNLIIPEANDDPEMIKNMCDWIISNLGTDIPLHFSRFFPNYKLTNKPPTPFKTLSNAYEIAKKAGIKYVYIGNARIKDSGTTFCPKCQQRLIKRDGYQINQNNISNGKCKFCYTDIYGFWE